MSDFVKEKLLNKYPSPVTTDETEIILKQMKKSICKIQNKFGEGSGFFCQISNKKLLLTNNHVINEELLKNSKLIKVKMSDDTIRKDIKIKDYYTSINYDTTIIEIDINDEDIHYLELDDEIFDENIDINNENVYIIQYPGNEQKAAVSYGLLKNIQDKYHLLHCCSTKPGSSGSTILKISNQKIIGIHKEGKITFEINRGTLLKYPINEYLKKNNIINKNKTKNNEINLTIKIEKEDINKNVYYLDNTNLFFEDKYNHLKELNELNTELFINNVKYKYKKKYFKPEEVGSYEIKIKFNIKLKDCSYMFFGCSNLTSIDLSSFDTENVNNMSYMFCGCSNLKNIDLSFFCTNNVTNMICMFSDCSNLKSLDLSSFDTKNVINMSSMFYWCSKLNSVKINNTSPNLIEELSDTNIDIIDQSGNKIPKII